MDSDPSLYKQFETKTIEFITCSNLPVQNLALKVVLAVLAGNESLSVEPKLMIKTVIEKCSTIEKEEIKNNALQILFWYMDNKHEDTLLSELNDELLNKNPKVLAIALHIMTHLLNSYGVKRMKNFERFHKNLVTLSVPPKPLAKPQAIEFYKELFRWIGEPILKEFQINPEVRD